MKAISSDGWMNLFALKEYRSMLLKVSLSSFFFHNYTFQYYLKPLLSPVTLPSVHPCTHSLIHALTHSLIHSSMQITHIHIYIHAPRILRTANAVTHDSSPNVEVSVAGA